MSRYFDSLNRRAGRPMFTPSEGPPPPAPAPIVERLTPSETPIEYGALREKLMVAANGKPLKMLVFAGCSGGEGCTRVVREFAETLASSGQNVLLVDADLQTSGLTSSMEVSGASLSDVVGQGRNVPACSWGKGKLTVVPSPAAHPDKERFLRSAEFAAWLDTQRSRYDYVLLDAPPLLRFADATLLGQISDAVVMVVRAAATDRDALVKARQQLERAGAKIVGAVLNRARNQVPAFLRPYITADE